MKSALDSHILSSLYYYDVETYHKLCNSGYLPRNLELLEGLLIQKMTISPLHAKVVNKLRKIVEKNLPNEFILRQESPLCIPETNSEPEPDLAVIQGNEDDFTDFHPTTAFWVVEISNSSLYLDRKKILSYAKAGISIYWIIDLTNYQIEVHSELSNGEYLSKNIFSKTENLNIPIINKITCLEELL